jgi:PPK2 family polyphosphate:nucleotide phosphotransferase
MKTVSGLSGRVGTPRKGEPPRPLHENGAVTKTNDLLRQLRVAPGSSPRLEQRDPNVRIDALTKQEGLDRLQELVERLSVLHNRLSAEATRSLLLVLQGMDASGKDGTIRNVFSGVNPQGCRVVAFRVPTATDLAHDYLWRVHAECPARGEMAIFNRSHYEDVVAARVRGLVPEDVWRRRYEHIRAFEHLLVDEGTTVLKVFLHVSREEQRKRLQERLDNREKRWKFRAGDVDDRRHWDDFQTAYEDAIRETSTDWAPWHVVPADHNWVRNLAVAEILVDALDRLDPQLPPSDPGLDGVVVV